MPCHLSYVVAVDEAWRTRSAQLRGWAGATEVDLDLRVTPDQQWILNGTPVAAVAGCIDVDLSFTPATNLLPIRRLGLPIGSSAPVAAAWLRFPELDLQRLDQVYSRVAEGRYEYSSAGGAFRASLEVSASGLVTDYPGLWREERS